MEYLNLKLMCVLDDEMIPGFEGMQVRTQFDRGLTGPDMLRVIQMLKGESGVVGHFEK